jgi:hypothetical protein
MLPKRRKLKYTQLMGGDYVHDSSHVKLKNNAEAVEKERSAESLT